MPVIVGLKWLFMSLCGMGCIRVRSLLAAQIRCQHRRTEGLLTSPVTYLYVYLMATGQSIRLQADGQQHNVAEMRDGLTLACLDIFSRSDHVVSAVKYGNMQ